MNIQNIIRLRNHLKGLQHDGFDMSHWVGYIIDQTTGRTNDVPDSRLVRVGDILEGSCGTVACMAGHTVACLLSPQSQIYPPEIRTRATELLGLTSGEANELFIPFGNPGLTGPFTKDRAIKVLDHLLKTGEVEWLCSAPTKPTR